MSILDVRNLYFLTAAMYMEVACEKCFSYVSSIHLSKPIVTHLSAQDFYYLDHVTFITDSLTALILYEVIWTSFKMWPNLQVHVYPKAKELK